MQRFRYNIHCSKLLSLPVLGNLLYRMQLLMVKAGLSTQYWISRKDVPLRGQLLTEIEKRAVIMFCSAWQLGRQLENLHGKYVFDYTGPHPKHLSLTELYNLEWALILAQSVTSQSIKKLGNLLPQSYPFWRPYILSVHQQLDVQCDFVQQTLNELLAQGNTVILFSHVQQPDTVKQELRKHRRLIYFSSVCPLRTSLLPFRLQKDVQSVWESIVRRTLYQYAPPQHHPVLWCFDPDDANILHFCPPQTTIIFDCVDYYTSTDQELNKRVTRDQRRLIDAADLMFVNSRTLKKLHSKQRTDNLLVPQGFDQQTFFVSSKGRRSKTSIRFFQKLNRTKTKYRAVVSFAGALSYRVDYPMLIDLIKHCPKYLFCLPETELSWPTEDQAVAWQQQLQHLRLLPNVLWFPRLQRSEVRALLEKTTVGLIPYDTSFELNRYCFPMKFFEYLSMGLPVLSTPIHELKYYPQFVSLGKNSLELRKKLHVLVRKRVTSQTKEAMKQLCLEHTWQKKIDAILSAIDLYQRRYHRFV